MPHWRCYIDKKIGKNGQGGEHSRVIDLEAAGSPQAEVQRMLKKDEVIGQIVTLAIENPEDPNAVAMHYGLAGGLHG